MIFKVEVGKDGYCDFYCPEGWFFTMGEYTAGKSVTEICRDMIEALASRTDGFVTYIDKKAEYE